VLALKGTIDPQPSRAGINLLMFVLTVLSVLFVGGSYGATTAPTSLGGWVSFVLGGWPFATALLGILLAHEFGHYFAARYHKVAVTLPYFIPFPSLFGTMGAFIQLKAPPTNRRAARYRRGRRWPAGGRCRCCSTACSPRPSRASRSPLTRPSRWRQLDPVRGDEVPGLGRLLPELPAATAPLLYMLFLHALGFPRLWRLDVQLNQSPGRVGWAACHWHEPHPRRQLTAPRCLSSSASACAAGVILVLAGPVSCGHLVGICCPSTFSSAVPMPNCSIRLPTWTQLPPAGDHDAADLLLYLHAGPTDIYEVTMLPEITPREDAKLKDPTRRSDATPTSLPSAVSEGAQPPLMQIAACQRADPKPRLCCNATSVDAAAGDHVPQRALKHVYNLAAASTPGAPDRPRRRALPALASLAVPDHNK
jgi:hypothetical protein